MFVSAAVALMSGCGEEDPPIAFPAEYWTREEEALIGQLYALAPGRRSITYRVEAVEHATVELDQGTGRFIFRPHPDHYGDASFTFTASDGKRRSTPARVSVVVENVNDPPVIGRFDNLANSPTSPVVEQRIVVEDPDPGEVEVSVTADDPRVVDVMFDEKAGLLRLEATRHGETIVRVKASDDDYVTEETFVFTARDFEREFTLSFADPAAGAIVIRNSSQGAIDFVLEHNGYPVFENVDSIVAYINNLPVEFEGEDFGRRLWRFVMDSMYHEPPLSEEQFFYETWTTLNSLGWGFCSQAAAVYVKVARAAGYEARVWGLTGHVVPEIKINGRWEMYDPDLRVFYRTGSGAIAGVEDLVAEPWLITDPVDPLYGASYDFPYSETIADIYASAEDNFDGEDVFLAKDESPTSRIFLPPGASLTYPGQWTAPPTVYDGSVGREVRHYLQAVLEIPDGWTGKLALPWMPWEIFGEGQVGIDDIAFEIGSPELTKRLKEAKRPVGSLHIYAGRSIGIVFFINANRFHLLARNHIRVRGLQTWAIEAEALPNNAGMAVKTKHPYPEVIERR